MRIGLVAPALLATVLSLGCQAGVPTGTACSRTAECARPLVCAVGRCRIECRTSQDCGAGDRCLVEPVSGVGVCSLGSADRCIDSACPDGFSCVDGECANACDRIVACPDGVCTDGACVSIPGVDAGVLDASIDAPIDAGPPCPGPRCDHVVQIAVGYGTFCARTAAGAVWCWGFCGSHQCSHESVVLGSCQCTPTPVPALDENGAPIADATDLAGGEQYMCALRAGGRVWCWGGFSAALETAPTLVPVAIDAMIGGTRAPLDQVTDIVGTRQNVCALRATGELYCWGEGANGISGTGVADARTAVAMLATELPGVRTWAMAPDHLVAITTDGSVIGVGADDHRPLGGPPTDVGTDAIHAVVNHFAFPARAIATSLASCGIFDDPAVPGGRIGCWGDPSYDHVLGSTPTTVPCAAAALGQCAETPQWPNAPSGTTWRGVAVENEAYAWADDGSLWHWGSSPDLMRVDGIDGHVIQALPHWGAVCAVTSEGDVWCAGANDSGQLGRGVLFSIADPVFARVVWP